MQDLVGSTVHITVLPGGGIVGGVKTRIMLPMPAPRKPYFGMGVFTPSLKKEWDDFYKDVAVLAWPTRDSTFKIKDIDEKALYYREPYTSVRGVKAYLPSRSDSTLSADIVIPKEKVLDLTGKLPTTEEVRQFEADSDVQKRSKLIDRLLQSDAYAANWGRYWRDVLTYHTPASGNYLRWQLFDKWWTEQIRNNRPWDQIVTALVTAEGINDEVAPEASEQ